MTDTLIDLDTVSTKQADEILNTMWDLNPEVFEGIESAVYHASPTYGPVRLLREMVCQDMKAPGYTFVQEPC